MAAALVRPGKTTEIVSQQDWRINTRFVAHIAEAAKTAITAMKPAVVIVIGLDESYFMASFEDIHTLPATKDHAGHYHIQGDVVVANKAVQS
jgi:hypothetical protein